MAPWAQLRSLTGRIPRCWCRVLYPRQGQNNSKNVGENSDSSERGTLSGTLAEIMDAWPKLSESVRADILATIRASVE